MIARWLEALTVCSVPAVLALAVAARIPGRSLRLFIAGVVVLASGLGFLRLAARAAPRCAAPPADRPLVAPDAARGYAGSATCRRCHPGPYASWHASHHRTMTQAASAATVQGDFGGVSVALNGARHRFERSGDAFVYVEPGGARHDVVFLTGSHRMQVPWFATGHTRMLAPVPFVWLVEEKRWVPRNAAFLRPPEVARHPPGERGRWNNTCLRCHSTDPVALVAGDEAATRVAELGISCEACHGPGAAHAVANENPLRRYELHRRGEGDPTIVNPARLPAARSAEVCGQCHSVSAERTLAEWQRWAVNGTSFHPGDELSASRELIRYREKPYDELTRSIFALDPSFMENRFWKDGMLRVTGRELSSLLETPCFVRSGELACTTCHEPHQRADDARPARVWADDQLRPEALGDSVCTRCHEKIGRDAAAHTRHAAGTEASRCVSCHMPFTTYGLQGAIRSHRISSPSVQESRAVGRPNACSLCHLDRPLSWVADRLAERPGARAPRIDASSWTADERTVPAGDLWLLAGDAGQRAIVAWNAGQEAPRAASGARRFVPELAQLLDDPYDCVRLIAWRSLRSRPELAGVEYDFLAPHDARRRARDAVLERGRDEPRALDAPTFERLLKRRDDRRVDLSE